MLHLSLSPRSCFALRLRHCCLLRALLPKAWVLAPITVLSCSSPTNSLAQSILDLLPARPWSGRSERLIAHPADEWITPAEAANFETTPRYAEVRTWLERLAAASPLLTIHTFGRTGEGRDLLYVRASKPGPAKPVVLVQAGIHAGEIDGKDAGLMLLCDIVLRGKDDLLDGVDLVFVPIYNIDGHEQLSKWNFIQLRGPAEKGQENNVRNINLNREPTKGIRYSPEGPRYSTGYGDFISVPTVLVENHMLKPYRQHVLGTYVLLKAALKIVAHAASRIVAAKARDRASRPTALLTRWAPAPQPMAGSSSSRVSPSTRIYHRLRAGWSSAGSASPLPSACPSSGSSTPSRSGCPRRGGCPRLKRR